MNVIPAKVAGVKRIAVVTPSKLDKIDPYILAILDELDILEIYQIGGAHSIAALAYGTESIKSVDKIFGPGNAYVASAKKQVFGKVGIDLIAGPSEILVVADNENNPEWVAADLIAQAEHDERAQSILITNDEKFANNVLLCLEKLTNHLLKKKDIKVSLQNYGVIIIDANFTKTNAIIDFIAPEHLHLQNKTRNDILKKVNNAGGIFVGKYATEAFGDYIVGTNHILPTSGAARFSSGLGVLDFMKRISIVNMNLEGFNNNHDKVIKMAEVEKLDGHKLSVKIRQMDKK
jgi:histidinol dehydrogenase